MLKAGLYLLFLSSVICRGQVLVGNLSNSLAGQWELNGNGYDLSPAGNKFFFSGTQFAQDRFGIEGNALKIVTTQNDRVNAITQNNFTIVGNSDRTISFWCKFSEMGYRPSSYTSVGVEWGKQFGFTGIWGQHSSLSQESTGFIFFWGDWADLGAHDTISPRYDAWRMITLSYNGSLGLEQSAIFVNGVQVPLDLPRDGPQGNYLDTVATNLEITGFSGDYIDSIAIWNRALSPTTPCRG